MGSMNQTFAAFWTEGAIVLMPRRVADVDIFQSFFHSHFSGMFQRFNWRMRQVYQFVSRVESIEM
jgi:hypothetical protein